MPRTVRYVTAPCSLGHVLIAAGERGICHLRLGDDRSKLVRCFRDALPDARPPDTHDDPIVAWCVAIVREIDAWGGNGAPPDLPLELRGTPFQRRVWQALRDIPSGEVRTYGAVARDVGRPNGARAVAGACARNPVALLVPCHRVVPSSGDAGGYRWGRWRKNVLLEQESTGRARRAGTGSSCLGEIETPLEERSP